MPPIVAGIFVWAFVAFLFWRELSDPNRPRISWAPFVWLFIAGSRFVSGWLNLRTPGGVEAYAEGSPLDRAIFLALIVWGTVVLSRRNIAWGPLLAQNKWLVAYLAYTLLSIGWTDEPFILFKRWIKDLGVPIMALVLLTEERPYDAIVATARRLSLVILPVSILFIKYYPEYGRGYSIGGGPMYTGVADQKNTLGRILLIIGFCYGWAAMIRHQRMDRYAWLLMGILVWLFYLCDSKTSQTAFVVAIAILWCARRASIQATPTRLLTVTFGVGALYAGTDWLLQVQDRLLNLLGRDPSLTHRTDIWEVVLSLRGNSWVGTGFQSYWTGERMAAVWAALGAQLNQAHSGYVEQFVNLGYIGVGFIIAIAIAALCDIRKKLSIDYAPNVFRLCVIVVALLYNYTEAAFYGVNSLWLLFVVATIDTSGLGAVHNLRPLGVSIAPAQTQVTRGRAFASGPEPGWHAEAPIHNSRRARDRSRQFRYQNRF